MKHSSAPASESGFSLVEVMVALIIICVGLLGIAKLEALMLSSTGTSRVRALVALQAASLADSMHADRDYWDGGSAFWIPANADLVLRLTEASGSNPVWVGTNAPTGADASCQNAVCNAVQLATYDLDNWANTNANNGGLGTVLPNSRTTITCTTAPATGLVSCQITIQWNENTVAANSQEAAVPGAVQLQTYNLVVEP
jgi:type IV pilus assembly protein PilV